MDEQLTEVENPLATPPTGLQVPFDTILTEIVKRVQSPIILGGLGVLILVVVAVWLRPELLDKAPALPWGLLVFGLIVLLLFVAPQAYFQAREQARQEWQEREKARRLAEAARARRERKAAPTLVGETPPPVETPSPAPDQAPARDLDSLRDLYLRELFADCLQLDLAVIDIRTATGAAELELAAVFTDLDVIEHSHESPQSPHPPPPSPDLRERGRLETRLPALAALSRYPYLVLLGDPGAGKSTLVNFVTLCLAGDGLAHAEINLKRLGENWSLPRLLPARVVLRDYAARGLPQGHSLYQFLQNELAGRCLSDGSTLAGCAAVVERALKRENGALLMLDGVDEVPDAHDHRLQLKAAVERFARDFPHCRILVTSRPYAYQDPEARLSGFPVRSLADFTLNEQVPAFIDRWYVHVGRKDRALGAEKGARYAEQLKAAIKRNPRLAELASRPLLLTLMASLHRWREGGGLPEKRQELYEASVGLLLDLWQRKKPRYDDQGRRVGEEYDVWTELGIRAEHLRDALNLVAYEAHRDQPTLQGTHDIRARALSGVLYELSDKAKTGPDADRGERRIIAYLTDRAGLLIERAQHVYTFPHRTFQEYLAACHLADEDFPFLLAKHLREKDGDERWREAALLAAAKAVSGSKTAIWNLVGGFCPRDYSPSETPDTADWTTALRAAQALVETEGYANVPDRQRPLLERLRGWLVALIEGGHLPPPERAAAGNALALLDDPRPGVSLLSPSLPPSSPPMGGKEGGRGEGLPEILWCYVPQGPFLMGSRKEDDPNADSDEQPQRQREIPYDYWIARYPVTNAQFALFVQDEQGYGADEWWTRAGFKWRERSGGREQYGGVFDLPNHPAVVVCWYEAVAYCAWLAEKLRMANGRIANERMANSEWANGEWRVRLPTEAEWEKAARGGLEIPGEPIITTVLPPGGGEVEGGLIPNPRPARRYPWGETPALDAPEPNRANYDESGIGATSAVGVFPGGVSPYGCLDVAGNVWEWCGTKWVDDYKKYDKIEEREALEGDATRVLRGGSWNYYGIGVRCAWRFGYYPHDRSNTWGFRVCVSTFSLSS